MKIISGTSNPKLAAEIADVLDIPLTSVDIERFRDQEIFVRINENVRGEDIFIIQPTAAPANDHLMELLIIIDALVRASAQRITAVIPYFGYARQDRKVGGRTPITAKLVANLISKAGADRVLTIDLHAGQIQGFFDIPTDNQRRPKAGEAEVMNIIGDVAGRSCILLDDIIDSGGTLCNAAKALKDHGANSVSAYITHGVLSDPAVERITKSVLSEVVICDTIAQPQKVVDCDKIREISVAKLLGEAIRRIANDESVSKLFG